MARAVEAMRGRRALLVGDCVLDTYLYGETVRVSREAPVIVVRQERLEHRLGGAANAAQNLAALGVETRMLGIVGADVAGNKLRALLKSAGVDVDGLKSGSVTTPQKTRVLAGAFGTARQQVLRIDDEPVAGLPESYAREVAAALEAGAAAVDVVVVSDYGLGAVSGPIVDAVVRLASRGVKVCVDSRYRLTAFRGATVVKPNVPEASELVGFPLADAGAVERAGNILLERLACEACLVTQGRGGMTLFRRGRGSAHVEIVGEEEVTDVTGAGDSVTATLSAAIAAGLGLMNGMLLSNCAAGVVVMKVGAATASPQEIVDIAARGGVELEPWGG
ncbi:MAG: bifunctional hydroxymethylpyrimidine kinase/phosphomethylpyrimidine kinase [Deltaproteobacteria bacterium]|nr:bifunctional hydroxymethylpyrimidine kinase/phosphomethylpyrimidine kinase [Deltaproteobacteria bacterium]